jgi:uncharacterized protein YggU (UPF0235/DUF167 family)
VARFWVRLTPRAAHDDVIGPGHDGALRVRVHAAPVDGAANEAMLKLIAARLGVPASALSIVAGTTARRKLLELDDGHLEKLKRVWPELVL